MADQGNLSLLNYPTGRQKQAIARNSHVPQTVETDLIGRTLGDFEIRQVIGIGGMGAVYQAHQRGMQRLVAIKVLPVELAANHVLLQRFYQEARSAARLVRSSGGRGSAMISATRILGFNELYGS